MRERSINLPRMRPLESPGEFREFIDSWRQERETLDAHLPATPLAQTIEERREELLLQAGHAVRTGHEDFLAWALKRDPQIALLPDPYTVFGRHTLLAQACLGANLAMAEALIPLSDPNARDSRGLTPLMLTLRVPCAELTRLMIPVSDASLADDTGRTALDIAAATGRADCVEALLPVSDATRVSGGAKLTPLRRAALCDEGDPLECLRLLMPHCDPNQRHSGSGHTVLHDVVARAHSLETEKLAVLLAGCDASIQNNDGLTPFGLAIRLQKWLLADELSEKAPAAEVSLALDEHGPDRMPRCAARWGRDHEIPPGVGRATFAAVGRGVASVSSAGAPSAADLGAERVARARRAGFR